VDSACLQEFPADTPVFALKVLLVMSTEQVPVWSSVHPNAPGPSAPDGSLGQLPLVVVCSLSTRSNEGAGSGFGG
jgi:hypothetical protein